MRELHASSGSNCAAGFTQEESLAGKGKALAVIAELERLVPLLNEAVQEETAAAVSQALAVQVAKQEAAESKDEALNAPSVEPDLASAEATTNGVVLPDESAISEAVSAAVNESVERLVQLSYFTQVFTALAVCSADQRHLHSTLNLYK